MYFTDRGIEELESRRGEEEVSFALARRAAAHVRRPQPRVRDPGRAPRRLARAPRRRRPGRRLSALRVPRSARVRTLPSSARPLTGPVGADGRMTAVPRRRAAPGAGLRPATRSRSSSHPASASAWRGTAAPPPSPLPTPYADGRRARGSTAPAGCGGRRARPRCRWSAAGVRPRACWDLGAVAPAAARPRTATTPGAVWARAARPRRAPDRAEGELHAARPRRRGDDRRRAPRRPAQPRVAARLRGPRDLDDAVDAGRGWRSRLQPSQDDGVRAPARPPPRTRSDAAALPHRAVGVDGRAARRRARATTASRSTAPCSTRSSTATVGPRPRSEAEEAAARRARDALVWARVPGRRAGRPAQPGERARPAGAHRRSTCPTRGRGGSSRTPSPRPRSPRCCAGARPSASRRRTAGRGPSATSAPTTGCAACGERARAPGRMTASAGLHNLPAELRRAVRPRPGRVLVRADLGQIEPRVLAAVSGDAAPGRARRARTTCTPRSPRALRQRPADREGRRARGDVRPDHGPGRRGAQGHGPHLSHGDGVPARGRGPRAPRRRPAHLRRPAAAPLRRSRRALAEAGGAESTLAHSYGRFARNAVVQGAAAELFKAWAATVRAGLLGVRRPHRALPARRAARGDDGGARPPTVVGVVERCAAVDRGVVVRGPAYAS